MIHEWPIGTELKYLISHYERLFHDCVKYQYFSNAMRPRVHMMYLKDGVEPLPAYCMYENGVLYTVYEL